MTSSTNSIALYTEAWQRCLPSNLSNLFYAYNENNYQTERVVSYRLSSVDLKELQTLQPKRISIHLACKASGDENQIPVDPMFIPFLAAEQADDNIVYLTPEWDPHPPFLAEQGYSVLSGIDEIPAEGAYLFILSWLEKTFDQIPLEFNAVAANIVSRVKYYTFEEEETTHILQAAAGDTDCIDLFIHMGSGVTVQKHPFRFRPIIEVRRHETEVESHFFDFSNPCPPRCRDKKKC